MNTHLPLTRVQMAALTLADDPKGNGRFIVAVKTTGIYCLPSCRPPRKANPENIDFYATPEEARAAGFRACKLCHPNDYYLGHHASETLIEDLVARLAREPGAFHSVASVARPADIGVSKLHELCRTHYHTTPADLLTRARVAAARTALLSSARPVAEIAYDIGFESLSAFNDDFRKHTAMSPVAYRGLLDRSQFALSLPPDYPIERMVRYLGRDGASLTDRVVGATYATVIRTDDGSGDAGVCVVDVAFVPGVATCRVRALALHSPLTTKRLHARLLGILGLAADPTRFETQVASAPELAPLIVGQTGLRLPLIADPFDALVWAIVGQQITLTFAYRLRRALMERVGVPVDGGLAPPSTATVAQLEPAELVALGFSRAKAGYLIGAARAVVDGTLSLGALSGASATRIERTLLAIRGIGPWSAHYLLLRSFGFLDCVPLGDSGLTAGLERFFALPARPDKRETLALMDRFSPYRSLATFHLWQRLGTAA